LEKVLLNMLFQQRDPLHEHALPLRLSAADRCLLNRLHMLNRLRGARTWVFRPANFGIGGEMSGANKLCLP